MSYTIKSIDKTTGNITVAFDIDNKDQVLADKSINDKATLLAELDDYEAAYVAGKQQETVQVDPTVTALIGKIQA